MADVIPNPAENRYDILIDGEVIGSTFYQQSGNDITFTHTVVDQTREEHGLGSQLVKAALDDVRDNTSYRLVAQCPFVAHWLTKNPDYQGLLTR